MTTVLPRAFAPLLLGLALACPAPLAAQSDWAHTGLDFGHLKRVALANCYDALDPLIGCFQAVGAALGVAGEFELTVSEPSAKEKAVKTFGPLRLVRRARDDSFTSVYRFWQALIAQRQRDVQRLEAHLADAGAQRVDFDALADFIAAHTPKDKVSERVARGINAYFAVVFDPHTQLSTRRDLAESMRGADPGYVGVGIGVFQMGTRYLITAVTPGGPAHAGGVRIHDEITRVDGQPVGGLSLQAMIDAVRGKPGTAVNLTLSRAGRPLEVTLTRRTIVREALETELLKSQTATYGYLRLQDFMASRACDDTALAIRRQRGKGATGWILDLRGNPGGSITMAACVAGLFLGPQTLVAWKIDTDTQARRDYHATSDRVTTAPLVVLVDGTSASGSELLAGALQHYQRAWIVGEPTFGKGSTQSIRAFTLPGATGLIRSETTGLFFLPSGRTSQLDGVTPDFVVPFRPGASEEERFIPREKDAYVRPMRHAQGPWTSPRPEEIASVSACVEQRGQARSRYESSPTQADYPRLYAIDVLECG